MEEEEAVLPRRPQRLPRPVGASGRGSAAAGTRQRRLGRRRACLGSGGGERAGRGRTFRPRAGVWWWIDPPGGVVQPQGIVPGRLRRPRGLPRPWETKPRFSSATSHTEIRPAARPATGHLGSGALQLNLTTS